MAGSLWQRLARGRGLPVEDCLNRRHRSASSRADGSRAHLAVPMIAHGATAPTEAEAVAAWRREVLQKVFAYMFFLLAAILTAEVGLSLHSGQWHALPSLAMALLLQGVAAFAKFLSVRARARVFTAAACIGVAFSLPTLGFALPIPFVIALMTLTLLALCVGRRAALMALLLLLLTIIADACYVCFIRNAAPGGLPAQAEAVLDPTQFVNWLRITLIFGGVALAIIGSVGFLVRRLEQAVEHNRGLFLSLEQLSREKISALEQREILQDKVRRSSELQLLGLLSATVAHDFNNLLMVIIGNASALKRELRGEAREDAADIERAGEQAAELCRRLLTLSGERMSGDEVTELNQFVEGELSILRRLVTTRITLEWTPGPPLWLKAARTELRQALLNLCANARDAMPKGGRLLIATSRVERARPGETSRAAFACLQVGDTGTGMDATVRERIFEPFFTTKGKAKGTGLGMAVVSAALERNQAFLDLQTELGKGSTFSLFFPLLDAQPLDSQTFPAAHAQLSGGETLLVVDDDEGARKMLTRYLQAHGYTLLIASDGEEALEILRGQQKIDLVVTDAVMPKLGGRALFELVRDDRPNLPFLFCSGFPAGTIPADFLEAPGRALLSKPFSEEALLQRVRQLLDAVV